MEPTPPPLIDGHHRCRRSTTTTTTTTYGALRAEGAAQAGRAAGVRPTDEPRGCGGRAGLRVRRQVAGGAGVDARLLLLPLPPRRDLRVARVPRGWRAHLPHVVGGVPHPAAGATHQAPRLQRRQGEARAHRCRAGTPLVPQTQGAIPRQPGIYHQHATATS
jgi:hypothetical protein